MTEPPRHEFTTGLLLDRRETYLGRRKDIKNLTDGFANSGGGSREGRTGGKATGREPDGLGGESHTAAPRAAPAALSQARSQGSRLQRIVLHSQLRRYGGVLILIVKFSSFSSKFEELNYEFREFICSNLFMCR